MVMLKWSKSPSVVISLAEYFDFVVHGWIRLNWQQLPAQAINL